MDTTQHTCLKIDSVSAESAVRNGISFVWTVGGNIHIIIDYTYSTIAPEKNTTE